MNLKINLNEQVEKYCIVQMNGEILVNPDDDYDMLYFPSHGFCQVEKDDKCGFINLAGELVIPLQYAGVGEFSANGLAFAECSNGLGGYIDQRGDFIIQPQYETGTPFEFGMAAVSIDGRYQFIFEDGSLAFNETFSYASGFASCGVAKVIRDDGRHELIDYHGNILHSFSEGVKVKNFLVNSNITTIEVEGKKALVNRHGEVLTTNIYDEINITPGARLHPFLRNGLWGYLNEAGEEEIPNLYLDASVFTDYGIAEVSYRHPLLAEEEASYYINDRHTVVDERLVGGFQRAFEEQFVHVYPFLKGLALAILKPTERPSSQAFDEEEIRLEDPFEEAADGQEWIDELLEITSYVITFNYDTCEIKTVLPIFYESFGDQFEMISIHQSCAKMVCHLNALMDFEQLTNRLEELLQLLPNGSYTLEDQN